MLLALLFVSVLCRVSTAEEEGDQEADGPDQGAVIAAIVIAVLIVLLVALLIIFRCCGCRCNCFNFTKKGPSNIKLDALKEKALADPESHPKFNDAVAFLDKVQDRFTDDDKVYRQFLGLLQEYKDKKITKLELSQRAEELFVGHDDLVDGFTDFLKTRRKTEAAVTDMQSVIENPAARDTDSEPIPGDPPLESHPKFTAAAQFVDQVSQTFKDKPHVYKSFLLLLNDFKPKNMSKSKLKEEVALLFEGHPELIQGFYDFISSKKKEPELVDNDYVEYDIEGDGNGEVHANAGAIDDKV